MENAINGTSQWGTRNAKKITLAAREERQIRHTRSCKPHNSGIEVSQTLWKIIGGNDDYWYRRKHNFELDMFKETGVFNLCALDLKLITKIASVWSVQVTFRYKKYGQPRYISVQGVWSQGVHSSHPTSFGSRSDQSVRIDASSATQLRNVNPPFLVPSIYVPPFSSSRPSCRQKLFCVISIHIQYPLRQTSAKIVQGKVFLPPFQLAEESTVAVE